jgi:uncharacterized protein
VLVREMTVQECLDLLERSRLGRIACARDDQPYVVPFYFAYHGTHLYSFATLGQKIEWMRTNPLVCVEVDEIISSQRWKSIVIFGRYEELPDTPQWRNERELAYQLLEKHAMWWQPGGVARTHHGKPHSLTMIYYRISIDEMTGHHGTPDEDRLSGHTDPPEQPYAGQR